MKNLEIARIFYEIADMLEFLEVEFKPRAYRRAAQNIETLPEDINEVYKRGELEEIPGVGKNIAEKIKELIETGKLKYYSDLKKRVPKDLEKFMAIPEIGPKTAGLFYKKLKIKNVKQLREAAEKHKLREIKGLGEKTEEAIIKGLGTDKEKRYLLGYVLPIARNIEKKLNSLKEVKKVDLAGSLRRMKETIGDIDILVISKKPSNVIDFFTNMENVKEVLAKGPTKSSILLEEGLQVDLRILDEDSYGSGLQYFIGSKEHSIVLRKLAMSKGLKLSEYGLFKGKKKIAGKTEEEIYRKLGLSYIEPELRENRGEIEAALKKSLPKLIKLKDIKGDLHCHSNWTDGNNTIEEMARKAISLGYGYMAISDHSIGLRIANGLDKKRLLKQIKEIDETNKKFDNFKILKSIEVNTLKDGNLDIPNDVLKGLDLVIAGIHYGVRGSKKETTNRILKAMDNKYLHVIVHPSGRLLNKREGYELDYEEIFEKARSRGIAIEINAQPQRLDLRDVYVKTAKEMNVKFVISTDAHHTSQMDFMELGVATARRGWIEKKDIINTRNLDDLGKFFNSIHV